MNVRSTSGRGVGLGRGVAVGVKVGVDDGVCVTVGGIGLGVDE